MGIAVVAYIESSTGSAAGPVAGGSADANVRGPRRARVRADLPVRDLEEGLRLEGRRRKRLGRGRRRRRRRRRGGLRLAGAHDQVADRAPASAWESNGFVTTASAPTRSARARSNGSNVPVRMTTGMHRPSGSLFTASQTS